MGRPDLSRNEWDQLKPHWPAHGRQGGRWPAIFREDRDLQLEHQVLVPLLEAEAMDG